MGRGSGDRRIFVALFLWCAIVLVVAVAIASTPLLVFAIVCAVFAAVAAERS